MTMEEITKATLDLTKGALQKAGTTTGITLASGLQVYDLEAPAKSLYPVLSPLRNRIPRVRGMGSAINWKAVTAINAGNLRAAVGEGLRNSKIQLTTVDKSVGFKTFGLDSEVTEEAEWDAVGFEDARARSTLSVLQSVMIEEEKLILGGHNSGALGTPTTPTLSASGSGATLPALTYDVAVVALNLFGYMNRGALTLQVGAGSGHSQKSAVATQAITLGQTLSASTPVVAGAVAYAWFVGGAGAAKLEAITTINSATFSAPLAGTGQGIAAITADESLDALAFDGLLTQFMAAGAGSYIKTMATGTAGTGTPLTADNAAGIVEIDDALQSLYDTARVSPTVIYCSTQEMRNITKKIVNAGASSIMRVTTADDGMSNIQAGAKVGSYLNKYTQQVIPLLAHPFLPAGTIAGYAEQLPYPNNEVPQTVVMRMVREYQDEEFARTARKYEHGVYARGALQCYFPAGGFIIRNIGNG
jgi:hypothetical protein